MIRIPFGNSVAKIVVSFFFLSPVAFAQGGGVAGNVNFLATVSKGVTELVTDVAPSVMPVGWVLLSIFGVIQLLQVALQGTMRSFSSYHYMPLATVVAYVSVLFRIAIATLMMTFYVNKIPGLGINFHQIFPAIGNKLAAAVSLNLLKSVFTFFNAALKNLPNVGMFQVFPAVIVGCLLLLIGLAYLALTVITAGSIIALGILSIGGPLMIPCYVLAREEKRFWTWLDNVIAYSMYGFTSAAFVFVMCHPYIDLATNVNSNWSAGQWLLSLPYLLLITGCAIYMLPKVPELTHMMFGGVGTSASGALNGIQGLVARGVAMLL